MPEGGRMDAIQQIFQQHYEPYRSGKRLPLHQVKAARNIARCRTGFFGVRLERCPEGHEQNFRFNACHHRCCPQCNALPRQRWLDSALPRLLPVGHRQIVFTIAHELLPLYRYNQSLMINLLFQTVAWVLKRFLSDPKWLGGEAGITLAYHSWGRNLNLHPHIHALVTEGGVDSSGRWQTPCQKSFLPARAMMYSFRGRYISALRKAMRASELVLPEDMSNHEFYQLLNQSYHKRWHVQVESGYAHGVGLIKYLSRYLRGGPIQSRQLRVAGDAINFRYKDHRTGNRKTTRIEPKELIRRVLRHVPPANQPMVRHYGLYSNRASKHREIARRELKRRSGDLVPEQKIGPDRSTTAWLKKVGYCATCGQSLEVTVKRVFGV